MPFGLKNTGSTYKKCVHIVLEGQISRNVEAYIDDIVVKGKFKGHLIADLEETFNNLRKNKMMLNPDKCSFGVSLGTWCLIRASKLTRKRSRLSMICSLHAIRKKSRS
jgi:hypothetical protein